METVDSASDQRTVNNVMRHAYRVLSDEEKAQMQALKDKGLELLLWGRSLRDDLDDPLMVDKTSEGEPKLLDDWRLRRLAGQGEMSP